MKNFIQKLGIYRGIPSLVLLICFFVMAGVLIYLLSAEKYAANSNEAAFNGAKTLWCKESLASSKYLKVSKNDGFYYDKETALFINSADGVAFKNNSDSCYIEGNKL